MNADDEQRVPFCVRFPRIPDEDWGQRLTKYRLDQDQLNVDRNGHHSLTFGSVCLVSFVLVGHSELNVCRASHI